MKNVIFNKMSRLIVVTAGIIIAFTSMVHSKDAIKIGTFLSVSGPASFLGDPELKTLKMYVEKINAEGGVLGRKLELVHYDVQHVAKKAVTAVKRLIDQDKVDVIVGGSTSGQTMAVIKLVEKAGIPFISLAGAAVITDPVKKWVFKTPHTDILAAKKIFNDMKENGWNKLGLLSGAGGFDKSCRKSVTKVAPGYGIEIVADETHGKGDTDMTPQLTKLKNAPGIQAFMYCGFGAATSIVAKNFKQLGLSLQHYQSHGAGSKSFIKNAAGAAEGARLPAAALLVVDALPDDDPQKSVAGAYRAAYEGKYKDAVSTFGGHAYDGLMIVVEAMKRAGSTDKEKVRIEIENTKNFVGADGIFTMSATDHLGLDEKSFVMVEVSNGTWKKLK
ncbi:MAG: ABC transporter substrate-binding protein [bacterium]|nr:ABC transporter substrate-binding protein [bacterium]